MIKHVLVPTDGSEQASIGVRFAAAMARHYGATLHGLHVVDLKLIEGPFLRDVFTSLGTAPYLNYQGNLQLLLEERGKAALESFAQTCRQAGVAFETSQVTGLVVRSIVEKSELCDLIVLGRSGEHSLWLDGVLGSTAEAVVRRASRPIIVTGVDTPRNTRYLVAYDGSPYARRALQIAAAVSADWDAPLCVLTVSEKRGEALLDEARSYLSVHPITVDYEARAGDPSETIVRFAEELHADLLVMGAYGHTKVREFVIGSTTTYAMNHAICPLLLTR